MIHFRQFAAAAMLLFAAAGAQAKTILFIGNSFTRGEGSPVNFYGADRVTDLRGAGHGGVPAIFKTLADEARLDWTVSLELQDAMGLDFHYLQRRDVIAGRYDAVVMQGRSDLDEAHPGNPDVHVAYAGLLAALFRRANPKVRVALVSTWSRADLTYPPDKHWSGKPIARMAEDLAAASALAMKRSRDVDVVVPVGAAWNRAFAEKVADPDPYDGIAEGEVDLWAADHYHASAAGYYLEALSDFEAITGLDPTRFGAKEKAAADIGLTPELAVRLQAIVKRTLAAVRR